MATVPLYTPEILALATTLAAWPLDGSLPATTTVRSRSCGSTLSLGLVTDEGGRIAKVGLTTQACAIGQAAAAIFAAGAVGQDAVGIATTEQALLAWLAGQGPMPDWPGLDAIAPARAYPGRHGAIMLAWQAAQQLLPSD
jgi:NifU-like protein involved in Fe-S cluster formation